MLFIPRPEHSRPRPENPRPRSRINIPVLEAVETVKKHIFSSRTDESFNHLFEATAHSAAELDLEPVVLPRAKKATKALYRTGCSAPAYVSRRVLHGQEFLVSGCYSPAA